MQMYEILRKIPNKLTSFLPEVWVANKMKNAKALAVVAKALKRMH